MCAAECFQAAGDRPEDTDTDFREVLSGLHKIYGVKSLSFDKDFAPFFQLTDVGRILRTFKMKKLDYLKQYRKVVFIRLYVDGKTIYIPKKSVIHKD